jgi:deoxycytidine triphosphate deaminase
MDAEELKRKWKHSDPHPEDRGLLLSDRIHELCSVGLLIAKGYDRKHLRPASYTLTIGDVFVDSEGKRSRLTPKNDSFVFKKNSMVYVSSAEELDLPYYVVARFNLRVKWVYRGVLLGTGPQVDPGFRGRLSCPLHNLTSLDITIPMGREFATIDFEKTTSFLPNLSADEREQKLADPCNRDSIDLGDRFFLLFRQKPFEALEHQPDHILLSSLVELREEVQTWRKIGIGLVIAFIALTVGLIGLGNNAYRQVIDNLERIEQNRSAIQLLQQRVSQPRTETQTNRPQAQQNPKSPR